MKLKRVRGRKPRTFSFMKKSLASNLETWFAAVKRPMPWRQNPTPYTCWLSEILMQQTTYAAVLPYYTRFLKRFPTVRSLASAHESEVLKQWEGLGYYARARNILKAARQIVKGRKILWPKTAQEWAELPGVGPYTAAALASVLSGEKIPVVDGNVARVFSRYFMLSDDFKKLPARIRLAHRLQPEIEQAKIPGDFNQAMMELGACVCTPTSPRCEVCPLAKKCEAFKNGVTANFPVKSAKKDLPVRRVHVLVVRDEKGRVLLVQNREGGLLKGLWELPTVVDGPSIAQVFSHFKQEVSSVRVIRADATFHDPKRVPLTTMTRKVLKTIISNLDLISYSG